MGIMVYALVRGNAGFIINRRSPQTHDKDDLSGFKLHRGNLSVEPWASIGGLQ